jgi:hypothetical protein
MFFDEHIERFPAFEGHPDFAAFGSHSCAVFCPTHASLHDDSVPLPETVMQQTVPGPQFSAPEHLSDVGGS